MNTLTQAEVDYINAHMTSVSDKKACLQQMGMEYWIKHDYRGTMEMATGTGKTRIGVLAVEREIAYNQNAMIYIVAPTETMRDVDWPAEFKACGKEHLLEYVTIVCWASLGKEVPPRDVDLVVLDEAHHLTVNASAFFNREWKVFRVLGLTATLPNAKWDDDKPKVDLLNFLCPSVFKVSLEQAVALGIVADFDIHVLKFDLDDSRFDIDGGSKAKPFKTTEQRHYNYLTKQMQRATYMKKEGLKFVYIQKRTQFLSNLKTKVFLAQEVIRHIMTNNERTLIFCGSIEQSTLLCGEQVYNSKSGSAKLELFCDLKINYLGVVQALNEGKNIPELDQILVVQLNSKELNLIQRIGRTIRWREGHRAKVVILVAKNTADEKWYRSAIENFDPSRITEHYVKPEVTHSASTQAATG